MLAHHTALCWYDWTNHADMTEPRLPLHGVVRSAGYHTCFEGAHDDEGRKGDVQAPGQPPRHSAGLRQAGVTGSGEHSRLRMHHDHRRPASQPVSQACAGVHTLHTYHQLQDISHTS